MKKLLYSSIVVLTIGFLSSCGTKLSFEDQIKKDVLEKISGGYCVADSIAKDAVIKNFKIDAITPIGDTGMIDIALEFDVVDSEGNEQHRTDAMLYLEKGGDNKMLAIFCDYDYRN